MKAANTAKRYFEESRLLVFNDKKKVEHQSLADIENYLSEGDLLLINRSATLPSSFRGQLNGRSEPVEIRLASFLGPSRGDLHHWMAFVFGEGDWRTPTEDRGEVPAIQAGDEIVISENLRARVLDVYEGRLLKIFWQSPNLLHELYQHGRPIQYSYHESELEVWDQQTIFSGPPISVEPPSASFQFTWQQILRLQNKGVKIGSLLHSAGISSSGSEKLDQRLPLPEWYELPEETVLLIKEALQKKKKIIAAGTTVLRALTAAQVGGELRAGSGVARLKIHPGMTLWPATALITGMHEPGSSHMEILKALCPLELVREGYAEAEKLGYRGHEYGDLSLLDCGCAAKAAQ